MRHIVTHLPLTVSSFQFHDQISKRSTLCLNKAELNESVFASNNLSASVVNLSCDRISCCKNSWISVYWQHYCWAAASVTRWVAPCWQLPFKHCVLYQTQCRVVTWMTVSDEREDQHWAYYAFLYFLVYQYHLPCGEGSFIPYSVHCSNSPLRPPGPWRRPE